MSRKEDITRQSHFEEHTQTMYSIYLCLSKECRINATDCIELIRVLFPRSEKNLFDKLVRNVMECEDNITDFHRDIAAVLVAHHSKIDGAMLRKISKRKRK